MTTLVVPPIHWVLLGPTGLETRYHNDLQGFADDVLAMLAQLYQQKGKPFPIKLFVIGNSKSRDDPYNIDGEVVHDGKMPVCYKIRFDWPHAERPHVARPPQAVNISAARAQVMIPLFDAFVAGEDFCASWGDGGLGVGGLLPVRSTGDRS
ncbi:hypothetical protein LTR09_004205 [Extremus antarcticus]|uniref:Uncharacterized protein n=1 Tax=Extremus antarcticus TaxID=702011 RepID=A0AAJ0DJ34_9PEZI|nr:hypothetical protein LTR09_004205 [Extremus antarcticus]